MSKISPSIQSYVTQDRRSLSVRVWKPDEPMADAIFLHGIVSHGGWYESSSGHLAGCGFAVHFLDRRGSGLNREGRGDVDQWTTWLSDVTDYISQLPQGRPRVLMGISWGGILATALARRLPDLFSGLGLICPGLFSYQAANTTQKMALKLARTVGLSRLKVEVPLQDPALFTNSPHYQRFVAEDPLALRQITIRFANRNLQLLQYAIEAPEEIQLPVLLMLAAGDPVTNNSPTRDFVERIGHTDKTVIEYEDASHTLEFEDDPSRYFSDLGQWCARITSTAGSSA